VPLRIPGCILTPENVRGKNRGPHKLCGGPRGALAQLPDVASASTFLLDQRGRMSLQVLWSKGFVSVMGELPKRDSSKSIIPRQRV
jgi:hypothetical protein